MRALVALLSLTVALAAHPQALTKSETGKIAVAQCYSTCLSRAHEASRLLHARLIEISDRSLPRFDRKYRYGVCRLDRQRYRVMEGCHYGCVDLESVYGKQNTAVKTRYVHLLRSVRNPLQEFGLWNGYSGGPAHGTDEFEHACNELWATNDYQYEPAFAPSAPSGAP